MKKIYISLATVVIIALIVCIPIVTKNRDINSDEDTDYDYEYFYTEDEDIDHTDNEVSTSDAPAGYSVPGVDTNPESYTVFVNKEYSMPKDYEPSDLVVPDIPFWSGFSEDKSYLRKEAAKQIEKMFAAANKDGYYIYAISGYRSYKRQEEIYKRNVSYQGSKATNKLSAEPGHSEHQTGLTLDLSLKSLDGKLTTDFGDTAEGRWIAKNCAKYGYIIRYPKGFENITGYTYEPWHIRYVGKKLAKYLTAKDMTLEEYFRYVPSEEYSDDISSDIEITP